VSGFSPFVVAAVAAIAAALAVALVRGRRRRARRGAPLSSALDPLPAGLKHLASSVNDLSDVDFRLPVARRDLVVRHRLGVLLGLR
jgi:hypothetical protein